MIKQMLTWLLPTIFLATVFSAEAQQQAKKIARIGFLSVRAGVESREEAFPQGLRELGHVEGQNIVIGWRFASGQADRLPDLAAELVRLQFDQSQDGEADRPHDIAECVSESG